MRERERETRKQSRKSKSTIVVCLTKVVAGCVGRRCTTRSSSARERFVLSFVFCPHFLYAKHVCVRLLVTVCSSAVNIFFEEQNDNSRLAMKMRPILFNSHTLHVFNDCFLRRRPTRSRPIQSRVRRRRRSQRRATLKAATRC